MDLASHRPFVISNTSIAPVFHQLSPSAPAIPAASHSEQTVGCYGTTRILDALGMPALQLQVRQSAALTTPSGLSSACYVSSSEGLVIHLDDVISRWARFTTAEQEVSVRTITHRMHFRMPICYRMLCN